MSSDQANQPTVLSSAPLEHPAMDYAFLRQEGIRHLERMAGRAWTDFNTHDPGITILEQLCYALTDLAYRSNYAIPDLLARDDRSAHRSLYSAAEILTSHPVTLTDLRKLVLDVEGVKNAWVEKVEAPPMSFSFSERTVRRGGETLNAEPVRLKGLYRVLIEPFDASQRAQVLRHVIRRLHANRGLGEDFEEVRIVDSQPITINASIEIGTVDDPKDLLREIYRRIMEYMSPAVPFQTLESLRAAGRRVEDIFDGPRLDHGFIETADLRQAKRRTELRTSDLIHVIVDVPGVRAVKAISISAGGKPEPWALRLDPAKIPALNIAASTVTLERNQLAVNVNVDVNALTAPPTPMEAQDISLPPGRERKLGQYYSIQHQLPATYGIGAMGLPESATAERKAQAKQLKAYLMLFDQLLVNEFAQLAHVKDLFSFFGDADAATAAHTYFAQAIDDPDAEIDDIRGIRTLDAETYRKDFEAHQGTLQQTLGDRDFRRRHRFLNHLLARFAEEFGDYALLLSGDNITGQGWSGDARLAQDKQAFLQDYPRLSSGRGVAFNYLQSWDRDNRSGLEQRITRKLGLDEQAGELCYVVEHILLRPMEGDEQQPAPLPILTNVERKDPYSLQISFVFPSWPRRFDDDFKAFIERTVREETPAHLVPYVRWFDQPSMAAFEEAYREWMEKRRLYYTDKLGL